MRWNRSGVKDKSMRMTLESFCTHLTIVRISLAKRHTLGKHGPRHIPVLLFKDAQMKLPMRFLVRRAVLVYALLLLTAVSVGIALAQSPSITISMDSAKDVGEGQGSVTVTVKLSAKCAETVTVEYAAAPGTAVATDDYESKSGTLVFAPDEVEKTININIVDDGVEESEESFTIDLSNASSNASIDTWQCTVNIIDDDGPLPTVYLDAMDAAVSEDIAKVPVTVNVYLSAKAPAQVKVKYATKDWPLVNGATAGSDYTAVSGTLTFEVGETEKSITVDILPDSEAEFAESFSVELSDPTAATLGSRGVGMITILDHNNRGTGLIPVVVSTTGGTFSPDPAPIDTWVDAVFKATATRPDTETSATIVPPPAWSWQVYEAKYSAESDTGPWTDGAGSGWMYLMTSVESTDGTSDFSEMVLSASFPIGGYWEVGCSSEAIYSDTDTILYFGSSLAQGKVTNIALTLTKFVGGKYVEIKGKQTMMVGEGVNLRIAMNPNPAPGTEIAFKWTIPGTTVKSYTTLQSVGEKKPLSQDDLKKQTISNVYWIDAAKDIEVKCEVTIGNNPSPPLKAPFDVLRPKMESFVSTITTDSPPVAVGKTGFLGDVIELHFGSKASPGITISAEVSTPASGAGKIAFIQLVDLSNAVTIGDVTKTLSSDGKYVLDNTEKSKDAPYGDKTLALGNSDKKNHTMEDTPGVPLLKELKNVVVFNNFKTYLMYHPDTPANIWVTLGVLEWNWNGSATIKDAEKNEWTLDDGSKFSDPKDPPKGKDSIELPEWKAFVRDLEFKGNEGGNLMRRGGYEYISFQSGVFLDNRKCEADPLEESQFGPVGLDQAEKKKDKVDAKPLAWGATTDGFTLSVSSKTTEYFLGEQINLSLAFKNSGPETEIWPGFNLLLSSEFRIIRPDGKQAMLTDYGKWQMARGGSRSSVKLKTNDEISYPFPKLNELFAMELPGQYSIELTERVGSRKDPSKLIPIRSNTIVIRVSEKKNDQPGKKPDDSATDLKNDMRLKVPLELKSEEVAGPAVWLDVLRNDPRLKDPIALNFKSKPGSQESLHLVQKATGVKLSLAEEPKEGKIVLGNMAGKAPAWKVMQQIAATQFTDGRWEKAGDGYVLHGQPKVLLGPDGEKMQTAAKKMLEKAIAKKDEHLRKFPLRGDPRLDAKVSVIGDDPPLAELLERLHGCTQLCFTLADNLENHDPKFGHVKLPNSQACIVMEWMAQKDLDDGRWAKTEDGYRLEGTSRALRLPTPRPFPWGWTTAALAGASLIVACGFVFYRRRAVPKVPSQSNG
jgi:hypothetical protein